MMYRYLTFFHNGSIGDFLMTLHFMENIHANDSLMTLVVAVPRNEGICRELAAGYPYVTVVAVNRWRLITGLLLLLHRRNCVVTPPTPGHIPLMTKLYAKLTALLPGSVLIGFDDRMIANRLLYNRLLSFGTSKLYYKTLHDLVRALGFSVKVEIPFFIQIQQQNLDEAIILKRYGLTNKDFIVVHPFGSNVNRSILGEELEWSIDLITELYPAATVVLSGSLNDKKQMPRSVLQKANIMDLTGKPGLQELAVILRSAELFIGVDTGITHLACVLGVPALVIAHNGTPHWLPYYNKKATIIYHVVSDGSGIYEGISHLREMRKGRTHYLDRVPQEIIGQYFRKVLA